VKKLSKLSNPFSTNIGTIGIGFMGCDIIIVILRPGGVYEKIIVHNIYLFGSGEDGDGSIAG